jgi:hypothetical protein
MEKATSQEEETIRAAVMYVIGNMTFETICGIHPLADKSDIRLAIKAIQGYINAQNAIAQEKGE